MTTALGIGGYAAIAVSFPALGFLGYGGILFCGRSIYPILQDTQAAEDPKNVWPWLGNLSWANYTFGGIPLAKENYNLLTSAEKTILTVKMIFASMATNLAMEVLRLALLAITPISFYTVAGGLGGWLASPATPAFLVSAIGGVFYGLLMDLFIRYHCSKPAHALS